MNIKIDEFVIIGIIVGQQPILLPFVHKIESIILEK